MRFEVHGGACEIDDEDLALVSGYRWYIDRSGYVYAQRGRYPIFMHRLITGARGGHVHHRNGVRSDNRRSNLEVLSAAAHRDAHRVRL